MPHEYIDAIEKNNEAQLKASLQNETQEVKNIAARLSAYANKLALLKICLSAGANLNSPDKRDHTCLHWAVLHKNTNMVQYLLQSDVQRHPRNSKGETPAMWAASDDDEALLRLLLDHSSLSVMDDATLTPLEDMQSDAEDAVLKPQYSLDALKLLANLQLSTRDIESLGISQADLARVVEKGFLGKLLRFTVSTSLVRALLQSPFITKANITPPTKFTQKGRRNADHSSQKRETNPGELSGYESSHLLQDIPSIQIRGESSNEVSIDLSEDEEHTDTLFIKAMDEHPTQPSCSDEDKEQVSLLADDADESSHSDEPETAQLSVNLSRKEATEQPLILVNPEDKSCCPKPIFTTSALPLQSESALKNVLSINTFHETVDVFVDGVWSALLSSLIINGLVNYYLYPDERDGMSLLDVFGLNSIANIACVRSLGRYFPSNDNQFPLCFVGAAARDYENTLGSSLDNPFVWPFLLGLPVLFGLINAIRTRLSSKMLSREEAQELLQELKRYQPGFWADGAGWVFSAAIPDLFPPAAMFSLLPQPSIKRALEKVKHAIIWDGQLPNKDRLALFQYLCRFAHQQTQFTKMKTLSTIADIADGIDVKRLRLLRKQGVGEQTIKTMLQIKIQALKELHSVSSQYYRPDEPKKPIRHLVRFLLANYLMWSIGRPQKWYLQPLYFLIKTVKLYYTLIFYKAILGGLIGITNRYLDEYNCHQEGKVWLWFEELQEYMCSVCGDLPIFYRDIFTVEDCFTAYLRLPRNFSEIMDITNRDGRELNGYKLSFNFSQIKSLDLSSQLYLKEKLHDLFIKWKPLLINLKKIYFNEAYFNDNRFDFTKVNFPEMLANFIRNSSVEELIYKNARIQSDKKLGLLIDSVTHSNITYLDLSNSRKLGGDVCCWGNSTLFTNFNNSMLVKLIFDNNCISNEVIKAIANSIPESLLTLSLKDCDVTSEGCISLAKKIQNSQLRYLNLKNNNLTSICAKALSNSLKNLNYNFTLALSGVGDLGARFFAKSLSQKPAPLLTQLTLSADDVTQESLLELIKALPKSKLLSFKLDNLNSRFNYSFLIPQLADALSRSNVISFAWNIGYKGHPLGDEGAKILAKFLPNKMKKLVRLELINNNIGNEGATAIAAVLTKSKISYLSLEENQIGEGLSEIAKNLYKSNIVSLNLNFNRISSKEMYFFSKSLHISKLKKLLLSVNFFEEGLSFLLDAIQGSPLEVLSLTNTGLSDKSAKLIEKSLIVRKFKPILWPNIFRPYRNAPSYIPATNLTELRLARNDFGCKGVQVIYSAWSKLNLSYSEFFNDFRHELLRCNVSHTSSSIRLHPYLPFLFFYRFYQILRNLIIYSAFELKQQFNFKLNPEPQEAFPKFSAISTKGSITSATHSINSLSTLFVLDFTHNKSIQPIIVNLDPNKPMQDYFSNFNLIHKASITYENSLNWKNPSYKNPQIHHMLIAHPHNHHLIIATKNTFFDMRSSQATNLLYAGTNNIFVLSQLSHTHIVIHPQTNLPTNTLTIHYFSQGDFVHIIHPHTIYTQSSAQNLCQEITTNSHHPTAKLTIANTDIHFVDKTCEDIQASITFNNDTALQEAQRAVLQPTHQNNFLYTSLLSVCETFVHSVGHSALLTAVPIFIAELCHQALGFTRAQAEHFAQGLQAELVLSFTNSPAALTATILAGLLASRLSTSAQFISMLTIGISMAAMLTENLLTQNVSYTWLILQASIAMIGASIGTTIVRQLPRLARWGWRKSQEASNRMSFWSTRQATSQKHIEAQWNRPSLT